MTVAGETKILGSSTNYIRTCSGGSTLHLSNDSKTTPAASTTVAYPSVSVDTKSNVAEASKDAAPTQIVNVKTNTTVMAPTALSANDVDVSASKNSKQMPQC